MYLTLATLVYGAHRNIRENLCLYHSHILPVAPATAKAVVGATGLEPATSSPPGLRASQLRYAPILQ